MCFGGVNLYPKDWEGCSKARGQDRNLKIDFPLLLFAIRPILFEPTLHSLRKLSMGLAMADLTDSKLMVTKAMARATDPAMANTNHPIETL